MHTLLELTVTLHDVTGGNPLFLRELLRELDEQVVKVETAELSKRSRAIAPVGVRALVDRRLERLTEHAHRVICAAATLGREVTVDTLAVICELTHEVAFEALEEGLAARLLVEDYKQVDRYLFPHVVVRNAVYATIPPAERQHLHRRIAEIIERQPVGPHAIRRRSVDIAHHYAEAAPWVCTGGGRFPERSGRRCRSTVRVRRSCALVRAIHQVPNSCEAEMGDIDSGQGCTSRSASWATTSRSSGHAKPSSLRRRARGNDAALLADVALEADGPWADGFALATQTP